MALLAGGGLVGCLGDEPGEQPDVEEGEVDVVLPAADSPLAVGGDTAVDDRAGTPAGGTEGPSASEGGAAAPSGTVTREGEIVVAGMQPEPRPTLSTPDGPLVLSGDLAGELGRLGGATVRVRGTLGTGGPGPTLRASSYEVLRVNGEHPAVGTLVRADGGFRLEAEDGLRTTLEQVSGALAQRVGAKVWVTGIREGGALRVQSFGVIRPE